MCPAVETMTVWVLLWVTVTTDFVVKFATVITKAVIALLPRQILPFKKKVCISTILSPIDNNNDLIECSSLWAK